MAIPKPHAPRTVEVMRALPDGSIRTDTLSEVVRTMVQTDVVRFDFDGGLHATYVLRNILGWTTGTITGAQ